MLILRSWRHVEGAKVSDELYAALKPQLPDTQQGFHVAIDRWTGGAADGLLYSTLEPMGISWEPITLTFDLQQLKNNWNIFREKHQKRSSDDRSTGYAQEQLVSLTLVLLLLRDMMAGRIPLGYGTNRGMGAIAINHIQIQGHDLPQEWSSLEDVTLNSGDLTALDAALMKSFQDAWTAWVNSSFETESGTEAIAS